MPVIPNGTSRRLFLAFTSCERVGLRREESLFDLNDEQLFVNFNYNPSDKMLDLNSLNALVEAAKKLDAGFANLPAFEPQTPGAARMQEVLTETATRLQDNYRYFHPLYAGQMLKPPHPVARLAYALAMFINPNNHALDGGRATSALEKEAVAEIAEMFGWQKFLGHLNGGGTMANLEALWVAGQLAPG
jgi:tyrosine decarboxylase/aspartate 1-decarboxylase